MEMPSAEHEQSLRVLDDPSDFEAFVRGQREELVRFLRRRTSVEEDAQDLAQESLIRLMRYRGHAPTAWASLLYRIAINALNDRLRRARTHREAHHTALDPDIAELASPEPSHEQRMITQQELAVLQGVLLGLPLRCRQIYLLNRIEGMSYTEIAGHCGISVKAVEKHISKALRLLRARLAPSNPTSPVDKGGRDRNRTVRGQLPAALPAHGGCMGQPAAGSWIARTGSPPCQPESSGLPDIVQP